jgi:hypothetical protein
MIALTAADNTPAADPSIRSSPPPPLPAAPYRPPLKLGQSRPLVHHHFNDVFAIQIADGDAPIMGPLAVQLAPDLSAQHEILHRSGRLVPAGLIPLWRRKPL